MAMNPRLLVPRATGYVSPDADARAYLEAVRVADGSNLEPAVAKAISDFVVGCKADGIWDAMKSSCILAGAKTLSGALTPLKGSAPTNNGPFVSGDYNRETGLLGDGSTKYLDSNRANDAAGTQDNFHFALYASVVPQSGAVFGGAGGAASGATEMVDSVGITRFRCRNSSSDDLAVTDAGLRGMSRSSSTTFNVIVAGSSQTFTRSSQSPFFGNIPIFCRFTPNAVSFCPARIAFYSIGESLDLADLDTRVSALISAIGAAL